MEELISKMKIVNKKCNSDIRKMLDRFPKESILEDINNDPSKQYIYRCFCDFAEIIVCMRDAMNEMAIDIIKLEDEVNGYGKGEI